MELNPFFPRADIFEVSFRHVTPSSELNGRGELTVSSLDYDCVLHPVCATFPRPSPLITFHNRMAVDYGHRGWRDSLFSLIYN